MKITPTPDPLANNSLQPLSDEDKFSLMNIFSFFLGMVWVFETGAFIQPILFDPGSIKAYSQINPFICMI
jgi:hypothetical protein